MRHVGEETTVISRRGFLKLGFTSISGMALLLLSGCVPAGDADGGGDD